MSITALDKLTVKQLTTTQVITTVYSAVKELVENALDAGATSVDVYLEDKGLTSIEVRDNGRGIPKADATYMAMASYTSKIKSFSDLESLETYGFRGEALNALCRVSDVKVITKTYEDENARCYTLERDGRIQKAEFCSRAIGTTVQVRSLFRNVPVRRQIVSSPKHMNQDVKLIENLLHEYGICRPSLRISYRSDSVSLFTKVPADTFRDSLTNVFGRKFTVQYEFLRFQGDGLEVNLTIPRRDLEDLSGVCQINYQHVFVNNRPVVLQEFDKVIAKLLSIQFEGKLPARKKPVFFLSITVPPSSVDVNLEPNKSTVLLVNQSPIIDAVEQLIMEYYGLEQLTPPEPPEERPASPPAYLDASELESEAEPPQPKRRKVEKESKGSNLELEVFSSEDKENVANGETTSKETEVELPLDSEESTEYKEKTVESNERVATPVEDDVITQLLEVNLGDDFDLERIEAMPSLDAEQVEAVTSELKGAQPTTPKTMQITASQWSRGHAPNLAGGTNVAVVGTSGKTPTPPAKDAVTDSEANRLGLALFSKEMRPKLIKENPGANLVQIAKLIQERWRDLTPPERADYRELGILDKALSDSKSPGAPRPQKSKQDRDAAANKKRLMSLLGNMNQKPKEESPKVLKRPCFPWQISLQSVKENLRSSLEPKKRSLVVGELNCRLWVVNVNQELQVIKLNKLFDALRVDYSARTQNPQFIENCLSSYLNLGLSRDLMHPFYDLQEDDDISF